MSGEKIRTKLQLKRKGHNKARVRKFYNLSSLVWPIYTQKKIQKY